MKSKTRIGATVALATGLLALASTAVAAGPQASYRDANERGGPMGSVQTSVADYGDAHERSQVIRATSPASVGYLDAAERATAGQRVNSAHLLGHVDVFERGEPVTGPAPGSTGVDVESGFAWSAAAIGASSALMLVLLFGASMILVRHSRGRPLAR